MDSEAQAPAKATSEAVLMCQHKGASSALQPRSCSKPAWDTHAGIISTFATIWEFILSQFVRASGSKSLHKLLMDLSKLTMTWKSTVFHQTNGPVNVKAKDMVCNKYQLILPSVGTFLREQLPDFRHQRASRAELHTAQVN